MQETNTIPVRNSGALAKALASNSGAQGWATFAATTTQPSDDGVYSAALENNRAFSRSSVRLYPYCDGVAAFSMRVWGWEFYRPSGRPLDSVIRDTWFPVLLAELYCQTGDVAGPPVRRSDIDPTADNVMLASEYFATQIDVIRGKATVPAFLATDGFVAQAVVDLGSVQLLQFDFYQDPSSLGMNCFFGFA